MGSIFNTAPLRSKLERLCVTVVAWEFVMVSLVFPLEMLGLTGVMFELEVEASCHPILHLGENDARA